jgi:hypothetical protein
MPLRYCEKGAKDLRVFYLDQSGAPAAISAYLERVSLPRIVNSLSPFQRAGISIKYSKVRELSCLDAITSGKMKTPTIIITYTLSPTNSQDGYVAHTELSDRWDGRVCKRGDPPSRLSEFIYSHSATLSRVKFDGNNVVDGMSSNGLMEFARNQYRLFATGCREYGIGDTVLNPDLSSAR